MKLKILALALLSIACSSAFAYSADEKKQDEQIIGALVALNHNEINASKEVRGKVTDTDVKQFANFMVKEHRKNLKETLALGREIGTVRKGKDAMALKMAGMKEAASLKMTMQKNLAATYINDMVTEHQNALDLIDNDLMKNATNEKLKTLLTNTRAHVAHHLEEAKKIQAKLPA